MSRCVHAVALTRVLVSRTAVGKHSKPSNPNWIARIRRKLTSSDPFFGGKFPAGKLVKMVDVDTREIHLLTRDFEQLPDGSYDALCGKNFLPASMVDPGRSPCARCADHVIPDQQRFLR